MPTFSCRCCGGIGLKFADCFLEVPQHLGTVAIEPLAFGGQLQRARGSREKQDTQVFFQALDSPG